MGSDCQEIAGAPAERAMTAPTNALPKKAEALRTKCANIASVED